MMRNKRCIRDEITLILLSHGKGFKKLPETDKDLEKIAGFFSDQIDVNLLYRFDQAIKEDGLIRDDYIDFLYVSEIPVTEDSY